MAICIGCNPLDAFAGAAKEMTKKCRYCSNEAALTKYREADYPYQRNYGPMWVCAPCKAWVGCHPGTEKPLGGLANKELRDLKMEAHRFFDPLWKKKIEKEGCSKGFARRAAYKWLKANGDDCKDMPHRIYGQ